MSKCVPVFPPIADVSEQRRHFRVVPEPVVSRCSKWRYSITSSARPSSESGVVETERLGGLEIDDQLDFGGLLDR
jgi:hypothetical protein